MLFPLCCGIAELVILRFSGPPREHKIISASFLALLVAHAVAGVFPCANFSSMAPNSCQIRDFSIMQLVLTQPRVVVLHLSQLLVPSRQKMGPFFMMTFPFRNP